MTGIEVLRAAKACGVTVALDGEDLVLEAPAPPPSALLDELARHKADIIALLRPGGAEWTAENWRAFFDERAVTAELDGRLSRPQAEARAFACCIAEWLNRRRASTRPG